MVTTAGNIKLGTYLKEKTKIPIQKETSYSPIVQEHILLSQQIIKEFEIFLMEKAYDGDSNAVDALLFSNVAGLGITLNKIGATATNIEKTANAAAAKSLSSIVEGEEIAPPINNILPPTNPNGSNTANTLGGTQPGKWLDDKFGDALNTFKSEDTKEKEKPKWLEEGWYSGENDTKGTMSPSFTDQTYENTFSKLKNSEDSASWLENLFMDCIPCGFRIAELSELDPWGDILDALKQWIQSIIDKLLAIWNMLKNMTWMDEFCALLDFFSFMCIPDLYSILALLQAYIHQIITSLLSLFNKGTFAIIWGLLSPFFVGVLSDLTSMLDAWIQSIMSPINCIINALMMQMNKIGGSKLTGMREVGGKIISKDTYRVDPKTGAIAPSLNKQDTAQWQEDYRNATASLAEASSSLTQAQRYGDSKLIAKYQKEVNEQNDKLQELRDQKNVSWAEEKAKRNMAIRKALSPDIEKNGVDTGKGAKRREEGLSELDAEGWLLLTGQMIHKSLYYVAGYIILARDSINKVINDLKEKLLGWLNLQLNSTDMKLLALDRLKKIALLVSLVVAILNILTTGKIICEPEDEEGEGAGSNSDTVKKIAEGLSSSSDATLNKVYDKTTGVLLGYQMAPSDFDPLTGNYIPVAQLGGGGDEGQTTPAGSITVNDKTDLKTGTFISVSNCLTTTLSEQKKFKESLQKIVESSKQLGIV